MATIVLFRQDLRVHDNAILCKAAELGAPLLPLYVVDPLQWGVGPYHVSRDAFGTRVSPHRARFVRDSLCALKASLTKLGSSLHVVAGDTTAVVAKLAEDLGASNVIMQSLPAHEELELEAALRKALGSRLTTFWTHTLLSTATLPFSPTETPMVFSQFRRAVEAKGVWHVAPPLRAGGRLPPLPAGVEVGDGAAAVDAALEGVGVAAPGSMSSRMFPGGEAAALARLKKYLWDDDRLRVYKETRNGMLGMDYSSKFSPFLSLGLLSPRVVYAEIQRYEAERVANDSTYWLVFEMLWRDYFAFLTLRVKHKLFLLEGPRDVTDKPWRRDMDDFSKWAHGETGYPIIDACMKELLATGFMGNRGRQIVASFLTKDLGIDWRFGAEWFERHLLDHDPCSNYGNWTYSAGVGTDPREDRYFSIPKQSKNYDGDEAFVRYWLPALGKLPRGKAHEPWSVPFAEQRTLDCVVGDDYPARVCLLGRFAPRRTGDDRAGAGRGTGRGGHRGRRKGKGGRGRSFNSGRP